MRRLALLLLLGAVAQAQKRPITHEDVWLMKRTADPVVSPDGHSVVFSLTEPDYDPAKQSADLWIVPADGSALPRRLTSTLAPENGAVFSPDGSRLGFVTRREGDDGAQVYIMPMAGGEARRLTNVPGGVSNPQWRPDGKAILFEADYDPIAAERKQRKSTARIFDSMPIRHWNAWLDEKKRHIFVQEVDGGTAPLDVLRGSRLAESPGFAGPFNDTGAQNLQAIWTPDGKSIVFTALVNRNEMMSARVESGLFAVPASGGEPRTLTDRGQSFSKPRFSPAGDALYALQRRGAAPGGRLYSLERLARFAWPLSGKPAITTEAWDRSVSAFSISPDGRTVYLEAEDNGFDQVFRIAAEGGKVERLFKVERGGYTAARPATGGPIALFQTSLQPPELVRLNVAARSHTALTHFNAERVAQIDAPDPIHHWFTAKNGKRIHSILFLPPQFDKTKRYPVVVFPHGGPYAMSKDAFSTRWNNHLLTSPGYVALATNYTGSTGFGEKFTDDIEKDVLRGPAQEILEAIAEAARAYPFIDQSRQSAVGASYGGYLMNWFNGHTKQFKCIVNHAGAINNESQYGANDGGLDRELRMGGPIWEKGGQWNDQSPIRYSGSFQTPTLLTQGELDFRVPLNESMTTFKILQRRKVPARLVIFPDEGHWILKGENSRLHMQEVLAWLKRFL
ncbi:MAG TPA: S9 family peptidase [Bryobacteraceae bacterium]|jgi:dipeptidyl aminopeptidase/acylaminoacyl peptidase|nr:S9 family peptidase [Bryobacteraceae bacterium]